MERKTYVKILAGAMALTVAGGAVRADELVIATTGGLMRNTLEEYFYLPFQEATGTEVIPFDTYSEHESETAVKAAGAMRVEGKEYLVKDGDVIYFRFNV